MRPTSAACATKLRAKSPDNKTDKDFIAEGYQARMAAQAFAVGDFESRLDFLHFLRAGSFHAISRMVGPHRHLLFGHFSIIRFINACSSAHLVKPFGASNSCASGALRSISLMTSVAFV